MTYQEAIDYLYDKLPMFSRMGAKALKPDLKNTIALCGFLGNPQNQFTSIHVAGTNGKGSVSNMLAAILQQHEYKTGLYTSPHLKDFRERIKVNGTMIPQNFVSSFVEKTKEIVNELKPSFFELTFAMAMDYMASQNVQMAVIETGLGGRLDSTNIIKPVLCVITNIGYDHMDILGDTLDKIASEKAGIIKPGVPVVIGSSVTETKKVFIDKATETHSPIFFAEEKYFPTLLQYNNFSQELGIKNIQTKEKEIFTLDLNGEYQAKNLITVLNATDILEQNFSLDKEKIKTALANVKSITGFYGRWEVIARDPTVILDVAHNAGGIKEVLNQINHSDFDHLHIVFGMVKDKDTHGVLELFPKNATYYFTRAHIPRALEEEKLQREASLYNLAGNTYNDVNKAIKAALGNASANDLILVCGSVFLIAEIKTDAASFPRVNYNSPNSRNA